MSCVLGTQKRTCTPLAVLCGKVTDFEQKHKFLEEEDGLSYPFPELVSSGRLEVHTLTNPTIDGVRKVLESVEPNVVYLQGEKLQNGEIGSLVRNGVELSTAVNVFGIFGSAIPDTVRAVTVTSRWAAV